jgi:hypothetical protein
LRFEGKVLFGMFFIDCRSDVWKELIFAHELKQFVELILIVDVLNQVSQAVPKRLN